MQTITIDPVTRIEGHSRISIHLDEHGMVQDAQFHVTQFRGFEKLCQGRPFYEMPALMARRKLAALAPGETIWVLANDPMSVVDIPHMCGEEGHAVIEKGQTVDYHRFLIRRRG